MLLTGGHTGQGQVFSTLGEIDQCKQEMWREQPASVRAVSASGVEGSGSLHREW